jgi:hypothetical protein
MASNATFNFIEIATPHQCLQAVIAFGLNAILL